MDVRPGTRVRARGLIWDVLEVERDGGRDRLSLRCAEGDMAGLEWELWSPPETIERIDAAFDPSRPGALSSWHLLHWAHLLNEIPAGATIAVRDPGRVRIEPYQLVPLMRSLDMPRVRLLLADGVGLGKTVQAGLIAAELIARRRAHRILIVAPSGPLLAQWEQETRLRFALKFTRITGAAEMWDVRRAHELGANPFDSLALCLTALDFAKQDHVLEELERSAWDLVIIDEAHHCIASGVSDSRETTHRRKLAEVLARRSDGLLLLTATPHDGHDAHFASLIELLDPSLVDGAGGFVGDLYRRHVIRRLKVHIRDPRTGAPLFRPRHVSPVAVDAGGPEHEPVRAFHRALAAFVVPRLRQSGETGDALAFVSLLKRSVSTISACLGTLQVVAERMTRRAAGAVETNAARMERARALRAWRRRLSRFGSLSAEGDSGQEALEIESMAATLGAEADSGTSRLIELGLAAEPHDPKLAAIILEVRLIRMEHPAANVLIYTEYTVSQIAAARALRGAPGIAGEVLTIGGQDTEDARADAALRFGESGNLILISTDALAEGLNLHRHCFHLIHLDLPYNPNRLEQRNGRIDRYGQRNDPQIRYLYLPGTFEERLLLHLIAKYEKARAFLDVMPDTLGVTSDIDGGDGSLTGGMSEEPDDLFKAEAMRMFDRSVEDSRPDVVAALLREIDRAFESFELMAVSHGWYGTRGINAGPGQIARASAMLQKAFHPGDLVDFVGAVITAKTGVPALSEDTLIVPRDWGPGLEDLPGFDPEGVTFRVSRDVDAWRDAAGNATGFLGQAHPLVSRAIRIGSGLAGEVAVARGDRPGLLLTFLMEIPIANRVAFRKVIAVMARPDGPPEAIEDWLSPGQPGRAVRPGDAWSEHFVPWADRARARAEALACRIMADAHEAFAARHARAEKARTDGWRRWLVARASLLCGAFVPPTGDLFGAASPGPVWRHQGDPLTRLVSFATDRATSAAGRREANDVIDMFRAAAAEGAAPGPVTSRPLGMLMLVPNDAG